MKITNGVLEFVGPEDIDENGRFVCPEAVESIARHTFFSSKNIIKQISLPNSVRKIDQKALEGCYELVSLNIPEGIKELDVNDYSVMHKKEKGFSGSIVLGRHASEWQYLDLPKGIHFKHLTEASLPDGLLVVNLENLEKILENNKYVQGKPVILNIKNVSELSVEKLNELSEKCNIQSIQIIDPKSQGEEETVRFPYSVEIYRKCREAIDKILSDIDIEKYKDMPDKEKIIFGRVAKKLSHITYDKEAWRKGIRYVTCRNLEGGLLNNTCVCVGYSEIIRNILACYGIEAKLIIGGAHCFNQVKLDGAWYNVDYTFDQPKIAKEKKTKYMLKSDKDFKGHSKMISGFKERKKDMQSICIPSIYKEFDLEKCERTISNDEILRYIYGDELVTGENGGQPIGYYVPGKNVSKGESVYAQILKCIKKKNIGLSEIQAVGKIILRKKTLKKDDKEKGDKND